MTEAGRVPGIVLDPVAHVFQGWIRVLVAPLPAPSGRVDLEVPMQSVVGGFVAVDGDPPSEPLELRLQTASGADGPGLIPRFLGEAFDWRFPSARTDDEGRFCLGGLPPTWRGELFFPKDYRLAAGERTLVLDRPRRDLLVELVWGPAITGRVLSPGGSPVANARVAHVLRGEGEGWSSQMEDVVDSGADGCFRIPLSGRMDRATLDVHGSGVGIARLETEIDPDRGTDVGDVWLSPTRLVRFRVTEPTAPGAPALATSFDGAGAAPIAGAVVSTEGVRVSDLDLSVPSRMPGLGFPADVHRSSPTDADGTCALELPLERVRVRADALGYRGQSFSVGPEVADPVEVWLERSTSLEVLFRERDGSPASGVRLVLSAPSLLEDDGSGPDPWQVQLGATSRWGSTHQHGVSHLLTFDGGTEGRVLVTGLRPGVPIDLEAQGATGVPIGWRESVVLGAGERRRIDVELETEGAFLAGRVLDASGAALPMARVELLGPSRAVRYRTDGGGRFERGPLRVRFVDVLVQASGHAPRYVEGHPVDLPLEVALDQGRSLVVTVLDGGGRRVPADQVAVLLAGEHVDGAEPSEDGRIRLEHVPGAGAGLSVSMAGCRYRVPVPDGRDEVVVRVPTPGSLVVRWERSVPSGTEADLRLRAADPPCMLRRTLDAEALEAGAVRLPLVLPGRYSVDLQVEGDEDGDGRREVVAKAEVDVRSGEESEVSLAP